MSILFFMLKIVFFEENTRFPLAFRPAIRYILKQDSYYFTPERTLLQ